MNKKNKHPETTTTIVHGTIMGNFKKEKFIARIEKNKKSEKINSKITKWQYIE